MSKIIKFLKPNKYTLFGLINKKIKFSTVYELNDFNEMNYFSNYTINLKEHTNII